MIRPTYIYPLSLPPTVHARTLARMTLADVPCKAAVGGMACGDRWQVVSYDKRGRITGRKCLMHSHPYHAEAAQTLATLRRLYRALPTVRQRDVKRVITDVRKQRTPQLNIGRA